jgi:hypothetical protein
MGYYYHWVDKRYQPLDHHRKLTATQQRQLSRRRNLVADLLVEMAAGDSVVQLYAGLLARTLICTDQDLMREFGEQVVKLSVSTTNNDSRRMTA